MIKLTLKGLAKYVASSPAAQRKILQDFKYPAEDEPFAMMVYELEALDCLKEYVENRHSSEWLRQQAVQHTATRERQSVTSARRLGQNAQAVLLYEKHFGGKELEILQTPKF